MVEKECPDWFKHLVCPNSLVYPIIYRRMCIFNFKIPRPRCRTLEDILRAAAGPKHTHCCDGPTEKRLACFSYQFQFFGQLACGSTTELRTRCSSKESHDQFLWETQPGSESWNGVEKRHQNSQCCSGGAILAATLGGVLASQLSKRKKKKKQQQGAGRNKTSEG